MSSLLRFATTASTPTAVPTTTRATSQSPPAKKQKMSLSQTYYLAHTARGKLSKEAARADHDLRLLVGHANLLDGLMLDLANAEQEQESWFNQTVKSAAKASEEPKQRVSWADQHTIVEEEVIEEEMYDEDSDTDSEDDEEELEAMSMAVRKAQPTSMIISLEEDEDEEMDDDFEDDLALTRTSSRSPPELMHEDSDSSDSEDESLPPSPPQTELLLSEKQRQAIATTSFYQSPSKPEHSLFDQESQQVAIAAY